MSARGIADVACHPDQHQHVQIFTPEELLKIIAETELERRILIDIRDTYMSVLEGKKRPSEFKRLIL